MTVSLAAVYIPIALQGGLTGTLFREFAFTLAGAVTISGVVALTLSPMMASKLLKPGIGERGLAVRPLDEALRYLEDEAAKILPKGYVIDYTRKPINSCPLLGLPWCLFF
jgi:multidrug efflux pump subunit AcrB